MKGKYCRICSYVQKFAGTKAKDAPSVVHHRSIHWGIQYKKKPTAWGNHGVGEQQCGHCGYRTDQSVEEEGFRKRYRSRYINEADVHEGVQICCGLSTLISESLSKPRELF